MGTKSAAILITRKAFTLVELLMVMGCIGMLFGLLLPAIQESRAAASRTDCQNNLKQIGLALHLFHDQNSHLPPGGFRGRGNLPEDFLSWRVLILPYLDQEDVWRKISETCSVNQDPGTHPDHIRNAWIKIFTCPLDTRTMAGQMSIWRCTTSFSGYAGVSGSSFLDGLMGIRPGANFNSATDGTSNTLLVGERPPSSPNGVNYANWYIPGWIEDALTMETIHVPNSGCTFEIKFGPSQAHHPCAPFHFWSLHRSGANFLLADGSLRFFPYSAKKILPAFASKAGGEVVELP